MKSADLSFPFSWEKRHPEFYKDILLIPQHFIEHKKWQFPGWEYCFKEPKDAVAIEFCSGNGDWIVAKALDNDKKNWVAVEKNFDRVRKIWAKMHRFNLSNLLIVFGEAEMFTRYYLPETSIDEIYINFPDPWPKRRHAKNRLVQKNFLHLLSRILKKCSTITMVTDDFAYSQEMIANTQTYEQFSSIFPSPFYISEWNNYGNSWFENLWREKGRTIYYMQFIKNL